MKNQTGRTLLLLGITVALFSVAELFSGKLGATWQQCLMGAAGGFALAATVSFIIIIAQQLKNR